MQAVVQREANKAALASFPPLTIKLPGIAPGFNLQYRATSLSSKQTTTVLLHGIGSGSGSWVGQLLEAELHDHTVLAWDAPGYGKSSGLPKREEATHPISANDYAAIFWAWLDALGQDQPIHLASHSLGAIVAAAAAAQQPQRIARLSLLAPAQGYGKASAHERDAKRNGRLAMLANLGIDGLARERSRHMLSTGATQDQLALVREVMGQVSPMGYTDATHLLANADLIGDLKIFLESRRSEDPQKLLQIASGELDTIVTPAQCQQVATAVGVRRHSLGACGHVCAVETPKAVSALLNLGSHDADGQ